MLWLDEGSRSIPDSLQTQVRRSGGKVKISFAILLNLLPGRGKICYASNILCVTRTTISVVLRKFFCHNLMRIRKCQERKSLREQIHHDERSNMKLQTTERTRVVLSQKKARGAS